MSHTAQIAADYLDCTALDAAADALGWTRLHQGKHNLYSSTETGRGYQIPGWEYPIVVRADGSLAYDDYQGAWGNVADLDRLHEEYSWAITEIAARNVGWQTERLADGVRVYHPSGATITVTATTVDLAGFVGGACQEAMRQLALPLESVQAKPTIGETLSTCQEAE